MYDYALVVRFEESVNGTLDALKRRGRVSYAAIVRQYGLTPDDLEALKDEVIDILGAARDEDGKLLVAVEQAGTPQGAPAEWRQVSAMACDLVASTPLSQRLDAEDLREVMRAYQGSVEAAVERHGGHAATWNGDGVMVYFGYPRAEEDDAVRAVRCGWEILRDLETVQASVADRHGVDLQARVGVHGGTVVVGDEGTSSGWQTHAFGDTPNVAARVESASAPGSVTVTATIQRLVAGHFDLEPLGAHELRGLDQPLELFRVLAPRANVARFEAERAAHLVPLVDRAPERAWLAAAADRARAGTRAAVLLTGEAGIGKSRLIHHLVHQIAADLEPLHAQCSQYGGASPLHPIVEALRERWLVSGDDGERRARSSAPSPATRRSDRCASSSSPGCSACRPPAARPSRSARSAAARRRSRRSWPGSTPKRSARRCCSSSRTSIGRTRRRWSSSAGCSTLRPRCRSCSSPRPGHR